MTALAPSLQNIFSLFLRHSFSASPHFNPYGFSSSSSLLHYYMGCTQGVQKSHTNKRPHILRWPAQTPANDPDHVCGWGCHVCGWSWHICWISAHSMNARKCVHAQKPQAIFLPKFLDTPRYFCCRIKIAICPLQRLGLIEPIIKISAGGRKSFRLCLSCVWTNNLCPLINHPMSPPVVNIRVSTLV